MIRILTRIHIRSWRQKENAPCYTDQKQKKLAHPRLRIRGQIVDYVIGLSTISPSQGLRIWHLISLLSFANAAVMMIFWAVGQILLWQRICHNNIIEMLNINTVQAQVCLLNIPEFLLDQRVLIIHLGPGFHTFEWFGSGPPPPAPLSSVCSTGDTQEDWERETICWGEMGEGGGRGAKSYDRKKAWSSINHSILSVLDNKIVIFVLIFVAVKAVNRTSEPLKSRTKAQRQKQWKNFSKFVKNLL